MKSGPEMDIAASGPPPAIIIIIIIIIIVIIIIVVLFRCFLILWRSKFSFGRVAQGI